MGGLVNVAKKEMNFLSKLFAHCDICGKTKPEAHVIATFAGPSYVEKEHYYLHHGCANVKLENPTDRQGRAQSYYNEGNQMVADRYAFKMFGPKKAEVGSKI